MRDSCARRTPTRRSRRSTSRRRRRRPACSPSITEADVAADGLGTPKVQHAAQAPRRLADVRAAASRRWRADRVRYVGDPVAMVVAETLAEAKDAAELVEVDYEPLPSVTLTADAVKPGAPAVWDECPDNISQRLRARQQGRDRRGFRRRRAGRQAALRHHAASMRSTWSRAARSAPTIRATSASRSMPTCSIPIACATCWRSNVFKMPGEQDPRHRRRCRRRLRHQGLAVCRASPDACGRRASSAGRSSGRCERSEALLADEHGRDNVAEAELALDKDGKFLGAAASTCSPISAPISSSDRNLLATFGSLGTAASASIAFPRPTSHLTASSPTPAATAPYRGAGRPEAIYVIERLIDDAARELGIDRVELRRSNLIPAVGDALQDAARPSPTTAASSQRNMDMALKLADVAGFAARAPRRRRRAASCAASASPTRSSSAGRARRRNSPRSASTRAAPRRLLMGTQEPGPGPRDHASSRSCIERLGIDARRDPRTSTATPTASPSASAPTARARP